MSGNSDSLEPREYCQKCGEPLVHESRDPLEEFCINGTCDYYRAKGIDGSVIRE